MAYIGNSPANVGNYQIVDDISSSFNGSLVSFALTSGSIAVTPAKSGQLLVGVNGVMQEPDDGGTNGFKVSGSNVVFSSAPASGDTFWAVYQGQNVDIGTPSDDVVDTAHIKDDAVTADKLANSINAEITANTAKTGITSGQAGEITANTAKTGITSGQASAITANTAKVTNYNQTKADIDALGIAASSITGALPAISGASLTGVIPSKLPSYATDAAATTAGYNVAGGTYFNTTNKVVKTYNGTYYHNVGTEAGDWAPTTFDILGDGSCISLHEFENDANDAGGLYNGTGSGIAYTTTYKKFGTHGLDVIADGEYYDVAGLPKFYACSIWLYMKPGDTSSNYIFDWRHDTPGNGKAYFYVNNHTINMADDTTYSNTIGDIYINGTQFTTGTYTFVDDTWYNIVVSVVTSDTTKGNWNQGIRIGNRSDGTDQGQLGYFDRFRAFNRSLNASDAQVLYQEGL